MSIVMYGRVQFEGLYTNECSGCRWLCTVELNSKGYALTNVQDVDGTDDNHRGGSGIGSVNTVPKRSKNSHTLMTTTTPPTSSVPLHTATNTHTRTHSQPNSRHHLYLQNLINVSQILLVFFFDASIRANIYTME